MDSLEEDTSAVEYLSNITIPSILIEKKIGNKLKKALRKWDMVNINFNRRESVPHPDDYVEYELWKNNIDECGVKCDTKMEFAKNFKGVAQIIKQSGYTQFTPHYITRYCPQAFTVSKQCKAQYINHGRYYAPD